MNVRYVLGSWVAVCLTVLAGCGGGGSNINSTVVPASSPTTAVAGSTVITIGDAPSDRVAAFQITVNSITLTDVNGSTASVLPSPVRVELTRLAGTFAPISAANIPQGTYVKATFSVSNPEVTIVAADGSIVKREPPLPNSTIVVAFTPNLVVSTTAVTLNFDFDVAKSVTVDAAGNVALSPTVLFSSSMANPVENRGEMGELEDVRGTVKTVASDSFTISVHDGSQLLSFKVTSATIFDGVTSLAELKPGMQVEVNPTVQTDGTMLAKKVEAENEIENETNGMELEGLVTSTSGTPVTRFTMVSRDVSSSTASGPSLGSMLDASVDSRTKFQVQSGKITVSSLPFTATFDADTLSAGQNVEVDSDGASGSPIQARKIVLHQQSLTGVVSNQLSSGGVATFTLTVSPDSVFGSFSGSRTITVYRLSSTELKGLSTISDGSTVRVRGLLFVDGSTFRLAAVRITTP